MMRDGIWKTCVDLARGLEDVGAMSGVDRATIEAEARLAGVRVKGRGACRVVVVGAAPRPAASIDGSDRP